VISGFGKTGYLFFLSQSNTFWISNVDGTQREPLFQGSVDAGWITTGKFKYRGRIYFTQRHIATGKVRYGFMDFP
jgi:hypothetical protein